MVSHTGRWCHARLLKALDMIDAIVTLIRGTEDRSAARDGLMQAPFEFSKIQAAHSSGRVAAGASSPLPKRCGLRNTPERHGHYKIVVSVRDRFGEMNTGA